MTNRVLGPRVPGSEHIPFNPINPHGSAAKVVTRDGHVIDWKSPFREPLYRVLVEDREKGCIPIFPAIRFDVATEWCSVVNLAIKSGRISGWSNPHVVPA